MSARRLDASALRDWAHTAVGDLISHTDEINRLNVFPVADAEAAEGERGLHVAAGGSPHR